MNILEIYEKYQIMPQLQEHQLRVAGVALFILNSFDPEIDSENVIKACLLHDMGNILKFDLKNSHLLLKKEIDVEYWQKVKDEYFKKYGSDEHQASLEIAKEIGASQRVLELIDCIRFNRVEDNVSTKDFGKKICEYSDDRVGLFGVVSLEQRFVDLRVRYGHRHTEWGAEEARKFFENSVREIEKQIFTRCNIKPSDIMETLILEIREKLRDFKI